MSPTTKPPSPSAVLADLLQVEKQAQDLKERSTETLNKARACNKFADFVEENAELLTSLGAADPTAEVLTVPGSDEPLSVISIVKSWSEIFAPQADLKWDKTEVAQKIAYLDAVLPFGALSEEDEQAYESVKETLRSVSTGTGQRAPRTPQERIEGRPERVITSFGGTAKSNQAGNLPNSVSNIKNAAVKMLNNALESEGKALTEEHAAQIMATVKEVVESGKPEATVLGVTFTAAQESE